MTTLLTMTHEENSEALDAAIARWRACPPAALSHHGQECCELARRWLLAMDYSQLRGSKCLTGPRWLSEKYKWGPSRWPLYWCEALRKKTLDCGAAAALAREVFTARRLVAFPTQLIEQFTEEATKQWATRWVEHASPTRWIAGSLTYHEACAVVTRDNEIRIWDPSDGCWLDPEQPGGYGGVLALRLTVAFSDPGDWWRWGPYPVPGNQWHVIGTPGLDRTHEGIPLTLEITRSTARDDEMESWRGGYEPQPAGYRANSDDEACGADEAA